MMIASNKEEVLFMKKKMGEKADFRITCFCDGGLYAGSMRRGQQQQ